MTRRNRQCKVCSGKVYGLGQTLCPLCFFAVIRMGEAHLRSPNDESEEPHRLAKLPALMARAERLVPLFEDWRC